MQPAKYERGGIAIGFAQEHVDAARAWQERAQLRHRERAANADETEGGPEPHDDERIGDEPGDRGRCAEDAAPDRDADDQRRAAGEPDDAAEIVRPVHFRDFAFSSSNQFSTTISLSGVLVSSGRIIRKRWSSGATAYCGLNRRDVNLAAGKSTVARPSENVGLVFTSTATRLPEALR